MTGLPAADGPPAAGDPTGIAIDCRGERLHLLPQRAIWWPAQDAVLVADVHIGKAATFRALGQPVPAGTTMANLQRLETLLRAFRARRLFVLGDFLHAPQARSPAILAALAAWRARLPDVACIVVEGNHDRRSGRLPTGLAIERVLGPLDVGPFALTHGDRATGAGPGAGYPLAGHLHPAYVLRGRAGDRLRLPCFAFGESGAILPAFGEFTGHADVARRPGDCIYVVGDGRIWKVPPAGR
jgi:DNA ligase-associated metallophosphoesterase